MLETFTVEIIPPQPVNNQFGQVNFATSSSGVTSININDNDCEFPDQLLQFYQHKRRGVNCTNIVPQHPQSQVVMLNH